MEHAQRVVCNFVHKTVKWVGLNPYFNGTCSKSIASGESEGDFSVVLILILMEHAQRGHFL